MILASIIPIVWRFSMTTTLHRFLTYLVAFILACLGAAHLRVEAQGPGGGSSRPPGLAPSGDDPSLGGMNMEMSMSMEMGMGMEGMYGGQVPSGPDAKNAIDGGILTALSGIDLSAFSAPIAGGLPTGPILKGQADQAFQSGYQSTAMNLYYAHMIVEFDDAKAAFNQIKYSKALRRPLWQVRWGASINVKLDGVTEPRPITASAAGNNQPGMGMENAGYDPSVDGQMMMDDQMMQMGPGGPGMRGGPPGMRGGPGMPAGVPGAQPPPVPQTNVPELMEKNLGLVATITVDEFNKRQQAGSFGRAISTFKTIEPEKPAGNVQPGFNQPGFNQPGFNPGFNSDPSQGGYDPSVDPRMGEMQMGSEYDSMDMQGMGMGGQAMAKAAPPPISIGPAPVIPSSDLLPMWAPGMEFVGEGRSAEMIAKAKENGIDFLLHFEVIAKRYGRSTDVQTICRCQLVNVSNGKLLIMSKAMDNVEAMQLTRAGRGNNDEYVREQIAALWGMVDQHMLITELPPVTADIAKKRVAMLVAAPARDKLQSLAEVRMFESRGLLTPDEVVAVFDIIGGDDAIQLLYAPIEERRQIVRSWVTQ
jgi:hypothetical protein